MLINKTNEYRPNNNKSFPNSSYYLRLYQKNDILEDEELNSLALPSSKVFYYTESLRNNDSEINFTLNDLNRNEDYQIYLIIKSFPNFQEFYEVYNFSINKITNEGKSSSKGKLFLLGTIAASLVVLIIIIIILVFSIFLIRMSKKNKELEEKVRSISFAYKDDDSTSSSLDDDLNPKVAYV